MAWTCEDDCFAWHEATIDETMIATLTKLDTLLHLHFSRALPEMCLYLRPHAILHPQGSADVAIFSLQLLSRASFSASQISCHEHRLDLPSTPRYLYLTLVA